MPNDKNSKQRFSDRVDDYVRFRPSYPPAVIETLKQHCNLNDQSVVADIGSGTGIFSRLLLETGAQVFGIEPNTEMRIAGETYLKNHSSFTSTSFISTSFISTKASAEATGLAKHSVDLITAAQAFHWFDVPACKTEFLRILKPKGYLALIWNERLTTGSDFLQAYEKLLNDYASDYNQVRHELVNPKIAGFYASGNYQLIEMPNAQYLNYQQLAGRLLSSSYAPNKDQPGHNEMMQQLTKIFAAHAENEQVNMQYTTRVYIGQLST